jgi:tetratricopeptide (TPR) repeat protein
LGRFFEKTSGGSPIKALILEKVPFFVLAAMICATTIFFSPKGASLASVSIFMRLQNVVVAYAAYIVKTIWPTNLSIIYPLSPAGPSLTEVSGALLLIATISAGVVKSGAKRPYFAVGWLWYLGTLVPVIGFIQGHYQAMADRFTYVPLIGLFIMFSWGLPDFLKFWPRSQAVLAAISLSIVLACMTVSSWQVRFWKNTVTLFERTLAVTHDNWLAHSILGLAFFEEGKTEEARAHFMESLRICPQCFEPIYGIAEVFAKEGKTGEAIAYYEAALYAGGDTATLHNNLGIQLEKTGRTDDAIGHFKRAVVLEPESIIARQALGDILFKAGQYHEALPQFEKVLEQDPGSFQALNKLGSTYAAMGNTTEAQKSFERALSVKPDLTAAHYNLANLFARTGRFEQAISHFETALSIEPDYLKARLNLGNTFLLIGKKDEAMGQYLQALAIKPDLADAHKNLGLLLLSNGKAEEAIFHFEETLRTNPNDQTARTALERLKRVPSQNKR